MFHPAHATLDHDPLAGMLAELPPQPSPGTGDQADLRALNHDVITALRARNDVALKAVLDQTDSLPPALALRTVWLPLALGIDAWEATGDPLPDGRALGRTLRAQVRAALLAMPEQPVSRWLVPSTLHDTTAAHLAALALSLRGMGARVWSWPLPPPGPVLLVGDAGSLLPIEGRIPTLSVEPGWPTLASLVA